LKGIFPIVQPEAEAAAARPLPLCREAAWDFDSGTPVFSGGKPLTVAGAEAVKVWIWKALMTARFRHDVYTWDYGCEAEHLIGQAFTRGRPLCAGGAASEPVNPGGHPGGRDLFRG